ncbi:MAG: 50S ribosomal protein L24 [Verrucomicrobiota bacterium]
MKFKIKRGDEVVVISGAHKGQRGKVLQVLREKERVIIEGVNMIKKHQKATQDNPEGAIVEREGTVHYSNVMLAERFDKKSA